MSIQEFINYVIANKEIILIILLIGGFATTLIRGAKKIISAVVTVMILVAALSFFGVPLEPIQDGFNHGVSKFEQLFGWAKDNVPGYIEEADSLLEKVPDAETAIKDWTSEKKDADDVSVHFIDVGQADCIFVQDGEDTLLIDVGNRDDDVAVTQYLDGLGIEQIDYFVATHPHEDHIGCAATILRLYDIDTMIKPEAENDTACYKSMMEQAEKSKVKIEISEPGETYKLGNGEFQILGPITTDEDELNNNSVVVRYQYGETIFLFTGDAERDEELEILDAGYDVSADVLKVGHHGSSSSTTYPWLRAVAPQYAVVSCGKDNSYGHPHEETLSKLRDAEVEVLRTDKNGTIVFTTDGTNLTPYQNAA